MSPSDSDDDNIDDLDFDNDEDNELYPEDDPLDPGPEDPTDEPDDDSDDSDDASDEDEDEDDTEPPPPPPSLMAMDVDVKPPIPVPMPTSDTPSQSAPSKAPSPFSAIPTSPPLVRKRSLSPAQLRKKSLAWSIKNASNPRPFTVEAICALPHPVPTHSLASSFCMTHLLTGSDDGYIRDYDIFTAVNGKNFLTAPQRHHSGVVEGIMKAGQLRFWWENPLPHDSSRLNAGVGEDDPPLSPVYSLAMHSDALWSLAGTDSGHINLFTVRHDPGRLLHVMSGHRGPVSALSMDADEKGFFSAGWDGEAIQWDLNTGQIVRHFTAHGSQLATIALRPLTSGWSELGSAVDNEDNTDRMKVENSDTLMIEAKAMEEMLEQANAEERKQAPTDSDAKSEASYDPLFDDDPEGGGAHDTEDKATVNEVPSAAAIGATSQGTESTQRPTSSIPAPKNAPPFLDSATYATYSFDLLMTAHIDGQVILWDRRVHSPGKGVGRLWMSEKTPPWCLSACWSADGGQLYVGRRNGTVDVWDVRQLGRSGPSSTPRIMKTLRNPLSSGVVSCVVAFPDCRHIACASVDNLRLWNVAETVEQDGITKSKGGVQFKIIPGHHGGYISQMIVDPGARFLVSASSNRGWHGDSTRTVFVHDIKHVMT
ncbi:hypothetical protein AMATHDRAFT_570 [Amanita thiersii Skay4041]|uniref:Transcription factor spt8 beta-propeller domain-containing protein n=1 Tax=Amanita thiersii Skay4041 TaxID=703135 RepID=A0A2A9NUS8_9AGAR|nr:hypothetical protein AMATHDRAFT_570 [Amanita thiersii Skay4041]